jgi:hypothetical protein
MKNINEYIFYIGKESSLIIKDRIEFDLRYLNRNEILLAKALNKDDYQLRDYLWVNFKEKPEKDYLFIVKEIKTIGVSTVQYTLIFDDYVKDNKTHIVTFEKYSNLKFKIEATIENIDEDECDLQNRIYELENDIGEIKEELNDEIDMWKDKYNAKVKEHKKDIDKIKRLEILLDKYRLENMELELKIIGLEEANE